MNPSAADDRRPPLVIGLGELLWDVVGDERRPGGAPANVAFHAGRLGCLGAVCSRVGDDGAGRRIAAYLRDHAIDTRHIQVDPRRPTGIATVDLSCPNRPAYRIHDDAAWDYLEFTPEWREAFASASAVCFGTLAQRSPVSQTTVRQCLSAAERALLVCDLNLRPPHFRREWIEPLLERADVLRLNLDEVGVMIELLGLSGNSAIDFARRLMDQHDLRFVCITRGANGCLAVSEAESVDLPGRRVNVVDAVGAGDAFTAALTAGLLHGQSLGGAAAMANDAAALVASHAGAMPDLQAEFAELMRRHASR